MKSKTHKKLWPILGGILGAIASFGVVFLMFTGNFQERVKFSGTLEEMVFTAFAIMIGVISLASSIAHAFEKEVKQ
jgi:hypothetical protein